MRRRRHVPRPIAQLPETTLPRGYHCSQRRICLSTGILAALDRIQGAEHVLGRQSVDVVVLGH